MLFRIHDGLSKTVFMGKHAGGKIENGYSWQVNSYPSAFSRILV
jgi:hypothetical protein